MQYHILNSRYQGPQIYRCRHSPVNNDDIDQCGGPYTNSEDLAIHVISQHCRTRYAHTTTKKYRKAESNGETEKQAFAAEQGF